MADESSKLGFDATEALAAMAKLKQQMDAYANSVNKVASSSAQFNTEGAKVENVLRGVATTLTLATAQLRQYASANAAASAASSKFAQSQNQARAAVGRGVTLNQPLGSRVRSVVANTPTFAESVRINPAPSGVRNPTGGTEAGLFAAFGRKPPTGAADLAKQVSAAATQITAASNKITLSWGSVIKVFGTQFAYQAVGQIVGAYTSAIDAARKYELQLAEVQTLSEEFARGGLNEVGDAVSKLSAEFGQPIEGVTKGLYETLSNQIGNAAESTRFLGEALAFSRSSLTSTADSVDLLSGVINSYGLTAASTADISDKLFRTIDLGRVRGEELANTIGRVLPLSSALGISFEEVAASLAHLTIQGVKASDAQTQITNVMLKLIRPTDALKQEFENLGIATPEAAIAAYGFQGALEKLTESGGTSAQEIGKLFNQIRGTRGVIGLVATDAKKYKDTLESIKSGSAGAAEAAANLIQNTSAGKLTRELTEARNFLVNDFGRSAVEVLSKFIAAIGGGENAMRLLGGTLAFVGTAVAIFGFNAAAAFRTFIAGAVAADGAIVPLSARLASIALPATLLITLPLAIAYFSEASSATAEMKAKVDELTTSYDQLSKAQLKDLQPQIDAQKKALSDQTSEVEQFFFKNQQAYLKDKAAAFKAQKEISQNLKDQLKEREGDLDNFVNILQEIQDRPAKTKKELQSDLLSSDFRVNSGRFERALGSQTDPNVQGRLLAQRSQKVLDAAKEAIGKGNVDFGKQLIDNAMSLAERSAGITQTRYIGESQINRVLDTQKGLYSQIVAEQEKQADAAKKVETEQRANVESAKALITEFNQLGEEIANKQLAPGTKTNTQELEALQAKQADVGKRAEDALHAVSTANISALTGLLGIDLKGSQRRLQTPILSPVTGKPAPLSLAVATGSQKVIDTLTKWEKGIDVDVRLHVQGLTGQTARQLSFEGLGKGQEQIAELNRGLQKLTENQKEGVTTANDYKLGQDKISAALAAMRKQATETAQGVVKLGGFNINAINPAEIATKAVTAPARVANLDAQNARINAIEAEVRAALGTGNTEEIKTRLNLGIKEAQGETGIADTLSGGHNAAAAAQLRQLLEGMEQVETAGAGVRKASNDLSSLGQGTNQLQGLRAASVGAAEGMTLFSENVSKIGSEAAAQIPGVDGLANSLKNTAEAAAAVPSTGAANRAFGGMVHYFDMGGFVPRGSDRYPAMLGGDEMVMNGKASRQFYSQLVAMNAGATPAYRSEGGQVNIGDINVNVTNNNSSPINGRQIATELRREIRRNSSFVY